MAMNYAIKYLREELNRERSYEAGWLKTINKGLEVDPERRKQIFKRQDRIFELMKAIRILQREIKPRFYQFLKPNNVPPDKKQ